MSEFVFAAISDDSGRAIPTPMTHQQAVKSKLRYFYEESECVDFCKKTNEEAASKHHTMNYGDRKTITIVSHPLIKSMLEQTEQFFTEAEGDYESDSNKDNLVQMLKVSGTVDFLKYLRDNDFEIFKVEK